MRPRVQTITPEQDDRLLLEPRAQYIAEMSQRVSQWAGPPEYIAISYQEFTELIVLLKDQCVGL